MLFAATPATAQPQPNLYFGDSYTGTITLTAAGHANGTDERTAWDMRFAWEFLQDRGVRARVDGTRRDQADGCNDRFTTYHAERIGYPDSNLSRVIEPLEDRPGWIKIGLHLGVEADVRCDDPNGAVYFPYHAPSEAGWEWWMEVPLRGEGKVTNCVIVTEDPTSDSFAVPGVNFGWYEGEPAATTSCSVTTDLTWHPARSCREQMRDQGFPEDLCPAEDLRELTQVRGLVGATCGRTDFDWYDISLHRTFVRKREKACVFLLSNRVAEELLDRALKSGKENLTDILGAVIASDLARGVAARLTVEFYVRRKVRELRDAAWNWLARGLPRALLAFNSINQISQIGRAVTVHAKPLTALTVLNQIKTKNACIQINADIDKKKLKLDWNLVYSPSALKHPKRDVELTRAAVRDRVERRFRPDRLQRHDVALACDKNGDVVRKGSARDVFHDPHTVGAK
jgi:hypothetical protein